VKKHLKKSAYETVLVTGCSSGLGKSIAEYLSTKEYKVFAGMRTINKNLINEWQKMYPGINPVRLDITSNKDCETVVGKIIKKEKRLDVIINNAGYALSGPVQRFLDVEFLSLLNTNVVGAFRLIKIISGHMRRQKYGKIINITSFCGRVALPNFSLYCASKFALEAMGEALYYEFAKENIQVTTIAPGAMTETKNAKIPNKKRAWQRDKSLLLRLLMPALPYEKINRKIHAIIQSGSSPKSVLMGRDTSITFFTKRFLPNCIFDRLMFYVWNK
jgi:short-subunit dehydrogenase